ncbi:MAG: apolipoprotein N-acyltransferase [Chitinophagaceae bacterium]|nr:MAG: apolipoprotein N-acyltransferase [Chitinophagaceae bacterium]
MSRPRLYLLSVRISPDRPLPIAPYYETTHYQVAPRALLLMTTATRPLHKEAVRQAPPPVRGFLRRHWLPLLLACVCNTLAVARVQYVPGLLAVACAAFLLLQARSLRAAAVTGVAFMCGTAILLNYWMVPVLLKYTGGNWLMAIGCYVASWTLMAPFFGLQFALFAFLRRRGGSVAAHWGNALLFAAVWVLFEWGRAWLFSAVPFMSYAWGSAAGQSTLLLQPAVFGGVFALTFLLVLPAYLIAVSWHTRRWRAALPAVALLLLQLTGGWALHRAAETKAAGLPSINIALVQPALSTDLLWDPQNGNRLVQHLLALNRQAAALRPALTVWTETTVPWTYRPDDDFVGALRTTSVAAGSAMLLGMSSDGTAADPLRSNSLYLFDGAGALQGRYDKQELLAGAERPFVGGLVLPFQSGNGTRFRAGMGGAPVPSAWGPAGLLLCNEATIPAQARARAAAGATWLAVLGNDNWFADTYVAAGHFNQCRIRAVENRKDLVVNINMGVAGVIRAAGDIAARFEGRESAAQPASLQLHEGLPPSHLFFNLLILVVLATCNRFLFTKPPKHTV